MLWIGLPLSFGLALLMVPAGVRGLVDAGLTRDNYRGRRLAFPLGAVLAATALVALAPLAFLNDRADLDLLDPELRRWIPYLLGVAFLGFLDDSLGQGTQPTSPRGWRGHAQALREGRLSTGAIKAIGALALAADVVSGQVAMVFALLGAEGSFGVKDTADRLLPDLLTPSPGLPRVPAGAP